MFSPLKWLKRLVILLLVLAGGAYAFAEVKAKGYAEDHIEAEVRAAAPASNSQATVSFPFVWDLITKGEVQKVEVTLTGYNLGPFLADRVVAAFNNIHLDKAATLRERELVISSIESLDITVGVSATEVSRTLPEGLSFEFATDSVVLHGPGFEVAGTWKTAASGRVVFETATPLPRGVAVSGFDLGMPFVDCAKRIFIKPGLLEIICRVDNPPVDLRP